MTRNTIIGACSIIVLFCGLASCNENSSTTTISAATDGVFTLVVIPDTQNAIDYTRQIAEGFAIDSVEIFLEQMEHIANRSIENGGDVAFVASLGDVWQHVTLDMDPAHRVRGFTAVETSGGPVSAMLKPEPALNFEIPRAIEGYQLISDAGIPFGVAPGNHDYDAWWLVPNESSGPEGLQNNINIHVGGLDNFRMAFGNDTEFFLNKDWYVDDYNGGGSSAQVFSAAGYQFLHFAFEMQAGDAVVDWAQDVIDRYPGLPTLISTHDYLNPRGERLPSDRMNLALADPEGNNSAEELWQEFIRENDQIFMVLSGHQIGQSIRVDLNDDNHQVFQILSDYQGRGQAGIDAGQPLNEDGAITGIGDGWFREMVFYLGDESPRIDIKTFSSHYDLYSSQLESYASWYKNQEQPDMSDSEFLDADEYTISLDDFYQRFGRP